MPNGVSSQEDERKQELEQARQPAPQQLVAEGPVAAAQQAAQAIPAAGKAAQGLIKTFPVLFWLTIPPKGPVILLLPIIILVWPFVSFFTFIGFRGIKLFGLPTQAPKSTVWEVVVSGVMLFLLVFLVVGAFVGTLCAMTASNWWTRFGVWVGAQVGYDPAIFLNQIIELCGTIG